MTEPVEGQPCPVCGLPDPEHDWDVHDASPPPVGIPFLLAPDRFGAALPDMLLRSSTRGRHTVRVLALHSTEGIMRARDLRAWAAWKGSSHASADETGALLTPADGFVPYHLAAWTLRSGNPWSENIELCAFARWTRAEWLSRPLLLEAAARWLAERSKATGVPLVKITAQQYRAGASGVIDHDDHTDGYQDGTHWDVGENFPWDVVIPRARVLAAPTPEKDTPEDGEDDMPQLISHYVPAGEQLSIPIPPVNGGAAGWGPAWLSILVDTHALEEPRPIAVRVGVMGKGDRYRPAFGKDYALFVRPATRPAVQLTTDDVGIVVSALDETHGVGVLVEYGPR